MDIYGTYRPVMDKIMQSLVEQIKACGNPTGKDKLYEHLSFRIKSDESVRHKLRKKGLEETAGNALLELNDTIGLRIVCRFIDDVYECVRMIRELPGLRVVKEKDYIHNAKPNGYRSYHMVIEVTVDEEDVTGSVPGHYYAEIQLRTIAMDTWAALEHELKYKKDISNQEMIVQELRRCANDLAACDISMQTLRKLIKDM